MDTQNGGRVSVSVFPTFQNMAEARKCEAAIQVSVREPASKMNTRSLIETSYAGKLVSFFFSEFGATFILVFLGCMGCVPLHGPVNHLQISFGFGLAVVMSVQVFAHLSGSHLNPIVTLAAVILKHTPWQVAPIYVVGQFAGAIAGFACVMLVTPTKFMGNDVMLNTTEGMRKAPGLCSPGYNAELSLFQAFSCEFIATGILALVCCGVWDRKNADKHDSVAVRFGLAIVGLAASVGTFTGANMNPARSFAPAVFNGDWNDHWVYWAGPIAGTIVCTVVYKYMFQTSEKTEEDQPEGMPLR